LRLYLGGIALRPQVGLVTPLGRFKPITNILSGEERVLVKLIVDAGTDRTANWLSSVMLRDDANPYRCRNGLVGSIAVVSRSPLSSAGHLRAHSLVASSE
jgi:hypothetical protein